MNNDPIEALVDLTVVDGRPVFRLEQPQLHCPCDDTGWLGREWLDKRDPHCTCGAGDPSLHTVLHAIWCDAVPCPFEEDHELSDHEPQGSGRED